MLLYTTVHEILWRRRPWTLIQFADVSLKPKTTKLTRTLLYLRQEGAGLTAATDLVEAYGTQTTQPLLDPKRYEKAGIAAA